MPRFDYDRIKSMPAKVRVFTHAFDGWIVGSSARFMCGEIDQCSDWDVIIPVHMWSKACRTIPHKSETNSFGGVKLRDDDGSIIDVWVDDVGSYFCTMHGRFRKIAVQPRYQIVVEANNE